MPAHLAAALCALGVWIALLAGGIFAGRALEARYIHEITPELAPAKDASGDRGDGAQRMERVKNQGLALQRAAFRQPDLLPLYGSSELLKPIDDRSSVFFRHYPTGFAIFPVGKAGSTSLILLQKIAAAAPARHARVAISLSCQWFLRPTDPHYYAGNFSPHQALALLSNPRLSFGLKGAIARRLLDFPDTLQKHPLLRFEARHLAEGKPWNKLAYWVSCPLQWLENAVNTAQDHYETALYLWNEHARWGPAPERQPVALDWGQLLTTRGAALRNHPSSAAPIALHGRTAEEDFLESMGSAREWEDFALLLRTLKELHLKPLLLSMPPPGQYLTQQGVSPAAIATYSARLHQMASEVRLPLEVFDRHAFDDDFLADHHDHLSAKGWMYYNCALDEFFHSSSKHLLEHRRWPNTPQPL